MISLSLTTDEIKFLMEKWQKQGLSFRESSNRLNEMKIKLHNLILKLQKKNKTPEEINKKFKQKFEEMLMKFEI